MSGNKINRIIIFNLESSYSGFAITKLFEKYHDRIVLVVSSQRYGGKYGSFYYQFKKNLKKSGFHFVNYLSLHLIYYKPAVYFFDIINFILRRKKKIYTLYQLSKKYNVPIVKTKEVKDYETVKAIKDIKPDLIISAYFDHVINKEIIEIPKYGIINIHTALLPKYKGPFPPLWPVIFGEKMGGVTVHYVNEKLDEGKIIAKKEIPLNKNESIFSMDCRFMNIGVDLLFDFFDKIENKLIIAEMNQGGYYNSYPKKENLKKIKLYNFKDFIKLFL